MAQIQPHPSARLLLRITWVGAADAERADSRSPRDATAAWLHAARPWESRRAVGKLGPQRLTMDVRRNIRMMQAMAFDQPPWVITILGGFKVS